MKTILLLLTVFYSSLLSANTSFIKDVFQDEYDIANGQLYLLEDNTLWLSTQCYHKYTPVQYEKESKLSNLTSLFYLCTISEEQLEIVDTVKTYQAPFSFSNVVDYLSAEPDFQPENFRADAEKGIIHYNKRVVTSEGLEDTHQNIIYCPLFAAFLETKSGKRFCVILQDKEGCSMGDSIFLVDGEKQSVLINLTNGHCYTCVPIPTIDTVASCTSKTITFENSKESWDIFQPKAAPLPLLLPNTKVYISTFPSEVIKEDDNSNEDDILHFLFEEVDFSPFLGKTSNSSIILPEMGDTYYLLWRIEE